MIALAYWKKLGILGMENGEVGKGRKPAASPDRTQKKIDKSYEPETR